MLKNFLRISLRNMRRQKGYATINVLGLALGLASAILIGLFVRHEYSFDRFFANAEEIYRVVIRVQQGGTEQLIAITPLPLADALHESVPEVSLACRVSEDQEMEVVRGQRTFSFEARNVGEDFLRLFPFPVLYGDPATSLSQPNSLVLTESSARKIFGTVDIVGELLTVDGEEVQVSAVLADVPTNCHLQFEALKPIPKMADAGPMGWFSLSDLTYLQIGDSDNLESISTKANEILRLNTPWNDAQGAFPFNIELQPMLDIHLKSNIMGDPQNNGDLAYVQGFAAIAVIILLLACINFINLTTARSAKRAREVGMRKVMGAQRKALIAQFLGESTFYTLLGIILAVLIAKLALPEFNNLAQRSIEFSLTDPVVLAGLFGILFIVGIISGSFPAFYLSTFQPTEVLKGSMKKGTRGVLIRQGLVVLQFVVAIGLIVGSATIFRQLNFLQTKRLGFDQENVVTVALPDGVQMTLLNPMKETIRSIPGVENASLSGGVPLGNVRMKMRMSEDSEEGEEAVPWETWVITVDPDFIDTWGLEIVKGRGFDPDNMTDYSEALIVNEKAVSDMDWGDDVLEKRIPMAKRGGLADEPAHGNRSRINMQMETVDNHIIGVVKNFNFNALYEELESLAIYIDTRSANYLSIRLAPGDVFGTLDEVKSVWANVFPEVPFEPRFIDDRIEAIYRDEIRFSKLVSSFTVLASIIAALGLFGLASYTAEARTKEIGIRKVMGSSVSGVVLLLSKEFTMPVLIAALIATPAAWYVTRGWLNTFAYRVGLSWSLPVVAILSALILAWISVGFQAWKAAKTNPVNALRYE